MKLSDWRVRVADMKRSEAARWLGVPASMYWRWEQDQEPNLANRRAIYRFTNGAVTPNCFAGIGEVATHPLDTEPTS